MEIVLIKEILKSHVRSWQRQGKTIGFVPTMGALHQGHLELVRIARSQCDVVVVSIFVNPLQFNNTSDLEKYPRPKEKDELLLSKENVDLLYSPSQEDFYSSPAKLMLDFATLSANLEGKMRPGHFSGVGIVVARLFHLVSPQKAYFGSKDLQQVAVVRALVRDLNFDVEIVSCPTIREASGLAMSSRNSRLSPAGKETASNLVKALDLALQSGPSNPLVGKENAVQFISGFPGIELEYLEWVDCLSMEIWAGDGIEPNELAVCLAAWVEGVRLIDNRIVSKRD